MQQRFDLRYARAPNGQRVFQFENDLLASLDAAEAERIKRVWDQAYYYPFGNAMPMMPTHPETGWRGVKDSAGRASLQTTYQMNSMAVDMGVDRSALASFPSFEQFRGAAQEGYRLFDLRVGPPWWSQDREYLEMAYTCAMAQEEPDRETSWCVEDYLGEGAENTPMWQAQTMLDHEYAHSSNIVQCARWAVYGHGEKPVLQPGWTEEDARATVLLNWQITEQPRVALGIDLPEDVDHLRIGTFPHRHELRRLVRSLNARPRGRPQRSVPCLR